MLKIKEMNTTLVTKFEELTEIRAHMRNQYKEYLEKNKVNKVFGLDSFHYQSRLLDLESKHLYEQYSFINNRMYCDYYKLYAMVKGWYKEQFKLDPKKRSYPIYKDLEQYTLFEFTEIHNLDIDISEMLKKISDIIHKKEEETLQDKKMKAGLNIDNYIHHNDYNNTLLRTKMLLYEKYLTSYHIYHMSFLSHLLDRVLLIFRQNTNTVKLGEIESWVDVPILNKEDTLDAGNVLADINIIPNPLATINPDGPETATVTEKELEAELGLETKSEADIESKAVSEPEAVPEAEIKHEPEPEAAHVAEAEAEPVPEPVPEAEPEAEAEPAAEPEPEPVAEPEAEPEPVAEPEPKPEAEPEPMVVSRTLPESKSSKKKKKKR